MSEEKIEEEELIETPDILKILKIDDSDHKLLKWKNPTTRKPSVMSNIRAILISSMPSKKEESFMDTVLPKLLAPKYDKKSYHYIVDRDGLIYEMIALPYKPMHSTYRKYTEFANTYFGELLCPAVYDNMGIHVPSPDFCTIGILFESIIDGNGVKYSPESFEGLVRVLAYILNRYCQPLEPLANIIASYRLNKDAKTDKEILNPKFMETLNIQADKMRTKWLAHYKDIEKETEKELLRGYPTLEITTIKFNEQKN
jgi:hypothetical protein